MSNLDRPRRKGMTFSWTTSLMIGAGLIVLFGFLVGLDGSPFGVATLRDESEFTSLFERLGVFVILSLFVERAVQVYVTAFLEQRQVEIKARVAQASARGGDVGTNTELADAMAEKQENKLDTRIRTTTAGLIVGTLLGLCGVSVLGALLEPDATMPLPLRIVDIAIVGTLLAGGAEPIHQIMQAITNSLTRLKEQTKPAPTP